MSIETSVQRLLAEKRLFRLPSRFLGEETPRTMVVSPDILRVANPPHSDDPSRVRRLAEFRLTLDAFSEYGHFTVAEDPRDKPSRAMMARVDPVESEFFSIRVMEPEDTDGIRCLGGFFGYEKFVALIWDFRENIEIFDDEVAIVEAVWRGFFGDETPHRGARLDDYLSNYTSV